jgi:hypothetical protein
VPIHSSFAASDSGDKIFSRVESVPRVIMTGAATTCTFAVGTTSYRVCVVFGLESIDSAYPTGTTRAATSAAKMRTRYRFRIARFVSFSPDDPDPYAAETPGRPSSCTNRHFKRDATAFCAYCSAAIARGMETNHP